MLFSATKVLPISSYLIRVLSIDPGVCLGSRPQVTAVNPAVGHRYFPPSQWLTYLTSQEHHWCWWSKKDDNRPVV